MANNFRITGTRYVSKGGHDSNDGLTPDSPKKTINESTSDLQVVGSGTYTLSPLVNKRLNIKGDGKTILIGNMFSGSNAPVISLENIQSIGKYGNNRNVNFISTDCIHIGNGEILATGGANTRSKFINFADSFVQNQGVMGGQRYDYCIFISTTIRPATSRPTISNSYIDTYSNIIFAPGASIVVGMGCDHNNIRGLIYIQDVKYAIQDQFTGTPQDNGYAADVYWLNEANLTANGYAGTIAGWDAAVATCINRDPKFNNASKLDFTLQADSPHIGRASDGFSNIGGTEYAQSFYAGISNPNILLFDVSEAIDTTTNNNDWRLKPGYTEGWIRAIIKVSNNDVQISSIPYIGNYAFDSDQLGGSSTNMNVPDSKPITNEYPDYLTVTTQAANDTTLIIAGHGAVVGDWLWVDGQYREITGVPDADTLTFATSLRAIVVVGTVVKIGTFEALASLNPNRLNMKMRSSKLADVNASNWDNPLTWDNDGLAPAGQYMAQEWNSAPMIDSLNQVGFGDDNYDADYGNPINLKVVDIMIYLRNNYRS